MAYTPTYTSDDIAPMVIDLGLTALGAIIGFATLVGLVIVYRWFRGKKALPAFK